ncbi:receptor-like serine/threonine kinase, partial [Trifolium medium]|nr:receptor-like serine/threonine kinase [Trifolium medium]
RNANTSVAAPPAPPPQDPPQISGNVYHVHPSDGPSSVSITPVLTHSNYHTWARSMCRALGGKNKFDFVDGTIRFQLRSILATRRKNIFVRR